MGMTADVRIPLYPLTVDDYEGMVDAGILTEDDRVELVNGQLAEMSPQGTPHAGMIQWLSAQLMYAIHPDVAGIRVQLPLRLPPLSMPEPDIAIVAPGVTTHAHPGEAMLVIEIAMTSCAFDLSAKAEVYAAAGVVEYWVIDVTRRTVHVHSSPSDTTYRSVRPVTIGSLRPDVPDAPAIDVETLFSLLD